MIKNIVIVVLLACTSVQSYGPGFGFLAHLHQQDWFTMDAESLMKHNDGFRREDADIPPESRYHTGPCDGVTYLTRERTHEYVRLEFEQFPLGGRCGTRLSAATVEENLLPADVENAKTNLLAGIRANGLVDGANGEYQWRSNDSQMKFVLTVFTERDGSSSDRVRLRAKLRHLRAVPAAVAGLPFEYGFFPPECGKR